MTISALGDSAVVISLGERLDETSALRVRAIMAEIERVRLPGVVDVVGAFASVAVFYERVHGVGSAELMAELEKLVARADETTLSVAARRLEIPVCYGGEFGPDLEAVARHAGMSAADVISAHAAGDYLVHAIGFTPGFPYLGGLPEALAMPRRATPRALVPAGSVAIGGAQTGVYPLATPGGWNLIGRTPLVLFDAARAEPVLLQAGDHVTFRAIDAAEFARLAPVSPAKATSEQCNVIRDTLADVKVVRAGMFTTVQDLGRVGQRGRGVPLSGAADAFALRVANLLVGNPEDAAALEFTLVGPELRFGADTVIALAGGDFGVPRWRPLRVHAGETLRLGAAVTGCRGYLAFAGTLEIAPVLGSRSTYVRAGIGGLEGRALRDGDTLAVRTVARAFAAHWRIDERILPEYSNAPIVRILPGRDVSQFRADWMAGKFRVTSRSDRMGVRLQGDPIVREVGAELVSSPVAPGTIQVPPDGQPIVLLADAQTIGGYPQIGHVATVDLPLMAQLRPGDGVRFRLISIEEAHALLLVRERALGMLREGLAQKLA